MTARLCASAFSFVKWGWQNCHLGGLSRGSYMTVPAHGRRSMIDSFDHINILWSSSGPLISAGTVCPSDRHHAEEAGAHVVMKQSLATSFLLQCPHLPPCPAWWVRVVLPSLCAPGRSSHILDQCTQWRERSPRGAS